MLPSTVVTWTDTVTGLHLLSDKVREDQAQLLLLIDAARTERDDVGMTIRFAQRLLQHIEGYRDLLGVVAHQVQRGGPTMFRGEV